MNILAFGIAKEILGGQSIDIQLGDSVTIEELKNTLKNQYPRLQQLTSFMIAINGTYADEEQMIQPGDEVAIIPPVSGG